MSLPIESLESRTLLSATLVGLEVQALHAEEATIKANITAWKVESAENAKIVGADLKRLGVLKIDKRLIDSVEFQSKESFNLLTKDSSKDFSKLNSAISALVSAGNSAAKKPGTVKLEDKVFADSEKASAALAIAVNALENDSEFRVNSLTPDLNALAEANSADAQTQTDINATKSELDTREEGIISQSSTLNSDGQTILDNFET